MSPSFAILPTCPSAAPTISHHALRYATALTTRFAHRSLVFSSLPSNTPLHFNVPVQSCPRTRFVWCRLLIPVSFQHPPSRFGKASYAGRTVFHSPALPRFADFSHGQPPLYKVIRVGFCSSMRTTCPPLVSSTPSCPTHSRAMSA